jgi:ADP-dependent NAD(P)H-hydrate dehydratase / NAD(P)H-hydrate epimerase
MVPEVIGLALTKNKTNTIQHIVKASQLYKWDSFIVGPGLGATDSTSIQNYLTLVQKIHEAGIPTVIDADALPIIHHLVLNKKMAIVTPHEGEFTRLFGPIENRLSDACKASQKIQQTIILKGHKTVISDDQGYSINTTGNPSMATAGSGDVLSGIIGGLWAQYPKEERQTKSWEVAAISTWLHGKAGDIAFQKKDRGLMASDITESLGAAFLYAKEAYLAYHHV